MTSAPEGMMNYELKAYIASLGSMPVQRIGYADFSENYESDSMSVWSLENGKYATITQVGCSCFDPSSEDVELHPTKESALEALARYERSHREGSL